MCNLRGCLTTCVCSGAATTMMWHQAAGRILNTRHGCATQNRRTSGGLVWTSSAWGAVQHATLARAQKKIMFGGMSGISAGRQGDIFLCLLALRSTLATWWRDLNAPVYALTQKAHGNEVQQLVTQGVHDADVELQLLVVWLRWRCTTA